LFAGFKPVVEKLTESLSIRNKVNTTTEAFDYVHFEEKPYVSGGAFLQDILNAIIENKKIEITYSKFFEAEDKVYLIDPHVLKEYQGIWYVSGWLESAKEIRTFALDRIKELKVLQQQQFKRQKDFKHQQYFKEVIGVSHPNNHKTVRVVLNARSSLVPYLKLLPLHVSQKIIAENSGECILSVELIPNREFFMKILSLGDQIKVSEPQSVVSELKETLKRMSELYR
jgi:predicted DNA-binding transcriptional regulator YafY